MPAAGNIYTHIRPISKNRIRITRSPRISTLTIFEAIRTNLFCYNDFNKLKIFLGCDPIMAYRLLIYEMKLTISNIYSEHKSKEGF